MIYEIHVRFGLCYNLDINYIYDLILNIEKVGIKMRHYKFWVSVIMGILGFLGIFFSSSYDFNGFSINFAWSLSLPLLVSLAWGAKYGLYSVGFGFMGIYPFVLGSYNGWASLVPTMLLYLWIWMHGYGATQRAVSKRVSNNPYMIQSVYILIRLVLYMTVFPVLIRLNPPFWNPEAFTYVGFDIIFLFAIKGIIVETILLAICDALLLLPFVRKLFKLKISRGAIYNTRIMLSLVAFGLLFMLIISSTQNIIIDQVNTYTWLTSPDEKTRINFLLTVISFFIVGGITVRYVQKMVEAQLKYQHAVQEIERINDGLEKRVKDRTLELQVAVEELEKFSYTISHDLKSPIRAIDAYTQFIMKDYKQSLDKNAYEMIGNIRKISDEMIVLIEKLLDYSLTAKADLVMTRINVDQMVRSIIDEYKIISVDKPIHLSFEAKLPYIYADGVLLKQVVSNILSNAIKFSASRDVIEIMVGYEKRQGEHLFYFRDNGVGFDMKYSGKLFTIFQRLHRKSEYDGSGIGLATIKKIIQKHNGQVWIESNLNVGTTVSFTIPDLNE